MDVQTARPTLNWTRLDVDDDDHARRSGRGRRRELGWRRQGFGRPAESLEGRILWAVQFPVEIQVGPNVNITRLRENQNEAAIAIDRTDPGRLFMGSVNDARLTGPLDDFDADGDGEADPPPLLRAGEVRGLIGAYSNDGGLTWTVGSLDADDEDSDPAGLLPPACCDPSVAWDDFGNLFVTFLDRATDSVIVSLSTNGGRTFTDLADFPAGGPTASIDQPTIVTGPGSVWVTFNLGNQIVASGARVLGFGAVEDFTPTQLAPRSDGGNFGDIAVGPNGEVMVTYQILRGDPDVPFSEEDGFEPRTTGPAEIFVNVDPDGFGPEGFGRRFRVTDTNVGAFDPVPAQNSRTIDAEAGLAWDRSGGPFNGRVWMVYTDEGRDESSSDTNIYVRFSDDNGRTWSTPRQANDEDFGERAQFLPRIALDQTTGNIAVTWHDNRTQAGFSFGPNDETSFFGTVGVPTVNEAGVAFASNVAIAVGLSDASRSRSILEYGDYTGLDFHNNVFYPVWADNSNSTGDNPSGGVQDNPTALATFDVYTARVTVIPVAPTEPNLTPVGPGSPLRPDYISKNTVTRGKGFTFKVRYESPNGINVATLGDDDLLVTGPKGYNLFADFIRAKSSRRGTVVTGTYFAPAPGGKFDSGDNGLYSIVLQGGAVADATGTTTAPGLLDQFLVSSNAPPQSPALQAAPPVSASLLAADDDEDRDEKLRAVGL